MRIKSKIRMGTNHMAMAFLIMATVAGAGVYANETPEPEKIPYQYTMTAGDTIYQVAARIATPKENINELTWRILKDNGIEDASNVQPGQVITIYVDPANPNIQHGQQ